jgi:hypothetical protein
VTIFLDRDGVRMVLSHVAKGKLTRHIVENAANLEAEAVRVFEIADARFLLRSRIPAGEPKPS